MSTGGTSPDDLGVKVRILGDDLVRKSTLQLFRDVQKGASSADQAVGSLQESLDRVTKTTSVTEAAVEARITRVIKAQFPKIKLGEVIDRESGEKVPVYAERKAKTITEKQLRDEAADKTILESKFQQMQERGERAGERLGRPFAFTRSESLKRDFKVLSQQVRVMENEVKSTEAIQKAIDKDIVTAKDITKELIQNQRNQDKVQRERIRRDQRIQKNEASAAKKAKAEQTRATRQQEQEKKLLEQERAMAFRNTVMTAASGGIGLLGQAGFPLLNIAFASMSGGVVGAGVAAATTAMGELGRAIRLMGENAKQAARDIGAVSRTLSTQEAVNKGVDAALGVGLQSIELERLKEREKSLREAGGGANTFNKVFDAWWASGEKTLRDVFFKKESMSEKIGRIGPGGVGIMASIDANAKDILRKAAENEPRISQQALEQAQLQLRKGIPGVGTDPYQELLRIQNNLFDPTKQQEIENQYKTIEVLKQILEETRRKNSFQLNENTPGVERMQPPVSNAQKALSLPDIRHNFGL